MVHSRSLARTSSSASHFVRWYRARAPGRVPSALICSKALDAGRARELEHVPGGLDVQAFEGDAAPALLADDADQMHERAAAFHARGEPVGLQNVAGNAVDRLEALEVMLGARPDETPDEKTLRKKCADNRLADEAGTAGHEHALRHGRIVARARAPRFSLRRRAGEPVS